MYSAEVLNHFENPRGVGDLHDATVAVEVSNPVCGDVLRLSLRLDAGQIVEARFRAQGCVPAIACGSKLVEILSRREISAIKTVTPTQITEELGGLPQASQHAAALAVAALHRALASIST